MPVEPIRATLLDAAAAADGPRPGTGAGAGAGAAANAYAAPSTLSALLLVLLLLLLLGCLLVVASLPAGLLMHSSERDLSVMDDQTWFTVADVAASRDDDLRCSCCIRTLLLLPPPLLLTLRLERAGRGDVCVKRVAVAPLPSLLLVVRATG